MNPPQAAVEQILQAAGIDPSTNIGEGQTAFSYLEGCIMSALDEIEERAEDQSDN